MELLDSVQAPPHSNPECKGNETDFMSCFSLSTETSNNSCDYLLVECRDPINTEPTATTDMNDTTTDPKSPTEDDSSGVFVGVGGMIVTLIVILIVTLLIVIILKRNNCRCMSSTIFTKAPWKYSCCIITGPLSIKRNFQKTYL